MYIRDSHLKIHLLDPHTYSMVFGWYLCEMARKLKNGAETVSYTHLGLDTGTNLVELVEHCAQVEGIQRIRLGSLDPDMLTPEFITRLAAVEKLSLIHIYPTRGCRLPPLLSGGSFCCRCRNRSPDCRSARFRPRSKEMCIRDSL